MMYSENDSPIYIASVLGERLKRIRLNRDMTQEEVAISPKSLKTILKPST